MLKAGATLALHPQTDPFCASRLTSCDARALNIAERLRLSRRIATVSRTSVRRLLARDPAWSAGLRIGTSV